jgi:hypothetical protein
MNDRYNEELVKPLAEMSVGEVEAFLESYEFYSPPWTGYTGKQYPESWDSGWYSVEDHASPQEGHVTPIGVLTLVDSYGGEGQGDDYWMVLKLTQGDVVRTFKMNGYHVSHDGSYYDGPFVEVTPKLKTITVWE